MYIYTYIYIYIYVYKYKYIYIYIYVIGRPQGSCGVWDIPKVVTRRSRVTTRVTHTPQLSEESMWLVPQLTAFHQSQAEKSIPLGNTFGFRQLREQRFEKCGLSPITLHFSRPLIGGRQATVVQIYIRAALTEGDQLMSSPPF